MNTIYASIIIPVLNESKLLPTLLQFLVEHSHSAIEIIVVDGGSSDNTQSIIQSYPVKLIECNLSCRALQMNKGALAAKGQVLYFLHADTIPPVTFFEDIQLSINSGIDFGSYRLQLNDNNNKLLLLNSFFTRLGWLIFQGGGDQSLFINKSSFEKLKGFDTSFVIMEDFDFIRRARAEKLKWIVLDKSIKVSDRKYCANNYVKVQIANLLAYSAFRLGVAPIKIKSLYYSILNQ